MYVTGVNKIKLHEKISWISDPHKAFILPRLLIKIAWTTEIPFMTHVSKKQLKTKEKHEAHNIEKSN